MALLRDTKARAKRIDLTYFKKPHPFRRWKRWLSILVPTAAAVWIAGAALKKDDRLYTSGGLAARHAMLDKQCSACHTSTWGQRYLDPAGWQSKLDASCLKCHDGPVHHANATTQISGPPGAERAATCSQCHREHEGSERLAKVTDRQCVTCHGDLKKTGKEPHPAVCLGGAGHEIAPSIRSFEDGHPEFALYALKAKDPTVLSFNHAVHMNPDTPLKKETLQGQLKALAGRRGVEGADGARRLGCSYCHSTSTPGGAAMAPILYETHCVDCHALKVDNQPVPHEAPNVVRDFLRSRLAAKGKGGEELAVQVLEVESPLYTSDVVNCGKCHQVKEADDPLVAPPTVARSGARTGPPGDEGRPRRWMAHASFSHDTHRTLRCLECHPGGDTSAKTSDLLMPNKASCLVCHSRAGGVVSTCVTCHTYHDKTKVPAEAARLGIREVLK
ncbi:MAG TPA: hypothetical protein VF950_25100 [Planctomycetota bacterium]